MVQESTKITASTESGNGSAVRASPASAGETLARDAEDGGGPFKEPPEYKGSIGRTTFDDRSSDDGTIVPVHGIVA
jgi:hypothetical protein